MGVKLASMETIPFDDFRKVKIKVGRVIEASEIEGSKNLMRLKVDFGDEQKQAVAGILQWYKPNELEGRKFVFVTNIEPRNLMGIKSECMILAAEGKDGRVVLLVPEKDVEEGSEVY